MTIWGISKCKDFEKRVLSELEGLLQTCRCMTESEADASRLADETMIETYRSWTTLRFEHNGRLAVYAVLAEQFLRNLPAGSRLNFFYPGGASDDNLSNDSLATVEDMAAVTEDDVRQAVSCLPPATRLATALSLVQGFSRAEIAEIMGVPVEIVRTWLRQGRCLLRRALLTLSTEHKGAGSRLERVSVVD